MGISVSLLIIRVCVSSDLLAWEAQQVHSTESIAVRSGGVRLSERVDSGHRGWGASNLSLGIFRYVSHVDLV